MRLSRRDFLKYSSLTLAGGMLAACAPPATAPNQGAAETGGETSGGEQQEVVTVTYLIRSDIGAKMQEWNDLAVKEFQELHPNIKVETIGVPWGDYNAKLLAMYAAGTPPEISANYAAGFPTFYANDAIQPLDPFIQEAGVDISVIEQQALDAVTREGKLWALPLAHMPTIVFYNADLFEEAGVDLPPTDWDDTSWTTDEMLLRARAIAKDTDDPTKAIYGMVFGSGQLGVFSWLWGVDPFNDKGGPEFTEAYKTGIVTEVHYDSPKFAEFIQWVHDLTYVEKVTPRPSDIDAIRQTVGWPMMSGRIAMYINGAWAFTNFQDVKPSWKWGAAAMPYGPAGVDTTPLFNDSWMLGAGAKEPEAGFQLLKYLALENGAKLYAEITGFFPANKENYGIFFDATMNIPNIVLTRDELEQVILGAFSHGYVTPGKTLDSYPEWNQAFNQTIGPIWNDEVSVEEGLQQVQQQFETIMASKA